MTIAEYLIRAIHTTGTRHVFGIQGDYVLNFYSKLDQSGLAVINTCDEQGAGFAADAYARIAGFGVVCVTYGPGGLKLVNTTAQAFAERAPVLVVSGAPGLSERAGDPLLHHKVRSFATQLNVFREVTAAQAVLDNPQTAAAEINRVIHAMHATKRPGYLELPRDLVDADAAEPGAFAQESVARNRAAMEKPLSKVLEMLAGAQSPLIMAGVEVHRFGLQHQLLDLLARSQFPFVTGVLGKSVVSEDHPQFVGVYAGAMSPDDILHTVEAADCVVAIGPLITDLSTGVFTHQIDPAHAIVLMPDRLMVAGASYPNIEMKEFLAAMIAAMPERGQAAQPIPRHTLAPFVPERGKRLTVDRLMACVNTCLRDDTTVIAEPGDPFCGALDLRVHAMNEFLSCAYYASLGFGVPAAIGVQLAAPKRRPLVLEGDGSFQMTGMELSTAVRYGLSPIVVILNNGGYGTFRPMLDGAFNEIHPWQYAEVVRVLGAGQGVTVSTEDELVGALEAAMGNTASPTIIDVRLDKYDCSERLKKLTAKLKRRVR